MNTKDMIVGAQILGTQSNGGGGSVIVPTINATATTLAAGSDATVTKTGSNTNVTFNFGIPQGVQGNQGPTGPQGPVGQTGPQGPAGQGVPIGGTTGQVLAKSSNNDYETQWVDQTGGGGTTYTPGDGIAILGQTISAKLSGQANNAASFASDGGIFVQDTPEYSAGDGVQISGSTIQANISTASDNATGILNGAIYTPATFQTTVMPMISVSTVPATPDVQVTATKGDLSVSGTTGADGKVELEVTAFGVWTVSGTVGDKPLSKTVVVSSIQTYTAQLAEVNVFGVSWDTTNPSTQLTRLTPETDPNGVVTKAITSEPQPAVGTEGGSSPFDAFMPWAGMKRYNIIDGAVSYSQDDPQFSQTDYDTMVYIPPFYYRREQNGNNQLFYVSDQPFEGAKLHPGGDSYIGRYICTSSYKSVSGQQMGIVSITTSRNGVVANGAGWQLQDAMQVMAYGILYLVEFADFNGMKTIGEGLGISDSGVNGLTDHMTYHTGAVSTGKSAVQYRWIENPYQQRICYLDGLYGSNSEYYVQMEPSKFSSDPISAATKINMRLYTPATYATKVKIIPGYEWAFLASESGGTSSTYVCEYGGTNFPSTSPVFCQQGNNMVYVGSCGEGRDTTYSYRAARAGFREVTS